MINDINNKNLRVNILLNGVCTLSTISHSSIATNNNITVDMRVKYKSNAL